MATLPKLESLIVVPSAGWKLLLTDNDGASVSITITAGNYYLTSTADGGTRSFLAEVKLRLDNGAGVTYTVTQDDTNDSGSTGKVTIAVSAGNLAIVWDGTSGTSTALRDILGFAGNIAAAPSATGANHAKRLWMPNSARTPDEPDPAAVGDPFGQEETDYVPTVAPSGAYTGTVFNLRMATRLRFDNLWGLKTRKSLETITNESLQSFYRDLMTAGGVPFRYHPDRNNDALYWTLFLDGESGSKLITRPLSPGWVGARSLHSVEFFVRQYVHVS